MPDEEFSSTGNPSGYIRGLLAEEIGPTAGLVAYREAGGAIQDSRWFALYGQVSSNIAEQPEMLSLDPYSVPDASEMGTWQLGRGGGYLSTVNVQIYDRDTGFLIDKTHFYVTDEPHTAVEAEQDAFDLFGNSDTENNYGETVLGALQTGAFRTVAYGSV